MTATPDRAPSLHPSSGDGARTTPDRPQGIGRSGQTPATAAARGAAVAGTDPRIPGTEASTVPPCSAGDARPGVACGECGRPMPVVDRRSLRRRYCSTECKNASRRKQYRPKDSRPLRPLAERLWARCERKANGCLEWQGFCHPARGYGQIGRGARDAGLVETHRAAWEVTYGPIPEGMFVCHRCDNPPCCEPEHLFLGTPGDNVADMIGKRRQAREFTLPHTRLSDEQVHEIRARYDPRYGPPKRGGRRSNAPELAAEFGITPSYVMQLVHWRYRKGA